MRDGHVYYQTKLFNRMTRLVKFSFALMAALGVMLSLVSFKVHAQTAQVWLTQGGGGARLSQQSSLTFGANSGSSTTINVNEGTTYQAIDGYGFTLTQGSAKVIAGMGATEQNNLLNELFGSGGLGMSVVRIGIGATDLSEWSYSYRDGASFSLAGPDLTYTIPILKKILAINPNIKVLATPWSAPMWMKTSGSFVGGTLKAENYESYGQYWLDYMNAMKGQGITIWAITPQNEPLNGHNNPSMTLTKENELGLINSYIGPKLRGAGFNCKIITYDHNCDNTEYPIYVANNSSYVDGAAFHLYAGSISALSTFRNSTGKNVYFTEQYTGAGGSFSGDLVWHTQNVTIGSANNWSRTALGWNLATDPNWGPHTAGGCSDCKGAVTINGSAVTRNQGYYIIGHFSKFVKPNAVRIGASSNHGNLITTAFKNSDGSKVVQVLNNSGGSLTFRVVWNNSSFTYTLTASSVVTFKWNGTGQPGAPIGSLITLRGNNNMYVSGENGTQAMRCNRATAGTWEQFAVVDAGGGKIGLRSMSKYVSSENGAASGITCNRTTLGGAGSWEHFDWIVQPDGKISLRGNNSQYVTSNNGVGAMTCNKATVGAWEAFTFTVIGSGGAAIAEHDIERVPVADEKPTKVFPNPVRGDDVNINLGLKTTESIKVKITDSEGKTVWETVGKGFDMVQVNKTLRPGLYYVQILQGKDKSVQRLMVE
jgi:glucosylceramidase